VDYATEHTIKKLSRKQTSNLESIIETVQQITAFPHEFDHNNVNRPT